MNKKQIFEKLQEIFQDVFDDESILINDLTTADDIDEWDSLNHVILIGSIEDEFGFRFDISKIGELKNVGSMVDLIEEML